MNCPHCKKTIDVPGKLWMIWYREDVRKRIMLQTGNRSLLGLIDMAVVNIFQGMEQFVGSMCLAWGRGCRKAKEKGGKQ